MKPSNHKMPILQLLVLKSASVIRIGRLAVVDGAVLVGSIGAISQDRLKRIKQRLAEWLMQS